MATNNITRLFDKKIKSCFRTFYSSNNNNNNNNYNNYNNNNNNSNNNNNKKKNKTKDMLVINQMQPLNTILASLCRKYHEQ